MGNTMPESAGYNSSAVLRKAPDHGYKLNKILANFIFYPPLLPRRAVIELTSFYFRGFTSGSNSRTANDRKQIIHIISSQ